MLRLMVAAVTPRMACLLLLPQHHTHVGEEEEEGAKLFDATLHVTQKQLPAACKHTTGTHTHRELRSSSSRQVCAEAVQAAAGRSLCRPLHAPCSSCASIHSRLLA